MAADDTHEFLTPQNIDADERLGDIYDFNEEDWELGAPERELAIREAGRLASEHQRVCSALHLRFGDVTADDLARASLSDDPDIQCARLGPLFKMCGLVGDGHQIERADAIKTIADAGPQSEAEMRLLINIAASGYMAARCAADAMEPRHNLAVMSMQMGNFSKLTRLGLELREGLQKLRNAQRPSVRVLEATPAPALVGAVGYAKALTGGGGHDPSEAQSPPDTEDGRD